jgi:hypothetical protein
MATKLKIEKRGDEIIPLEMHFFVDSLLLVTQIIKGNQLAQWFLRRRFLCEFPIGSYVKLGSGVGAILIEGPNRQTHFWKRTIQ